MAIKVVRSIFRGAGVSGDYLWMIDQPEFARALFIFNDNEEQFDDFVAGNYDSQVRPTSVPTAGDAMIVKVVRARLVAT